MATAVPTDYTNQVEYTEEVAEFSPAVVEEMRSHLRKYPPERKRSALIPLLFVIQRERGYVDNAGVNFLAKFLDLEVTNVWETATFYTMFNPDLQNAFVQDHGRAGNHRAYLQSARHSSGRDDRGRQVYRQPGRMSRKLRHRADDADQFRLSRRFDD
jgi:hypothetical protein